MKGVFFIVGPTATGKSELAAEIACRLGAEIVSADAFQVYRGLDLLTAKPDGPTLAKAPHHLLSAVPLSEEMNVEKFRTAAGEALRDIQARGKQAIVVGGSGLYVKVLTHGLSQLPAADPKLRAQLSELSLDELCGQLIHFDPKAVDQVDLKNRRRVTRALEICLVTGKPVSEQRFGAGPAERVLPRTASAATGGVLPRTTSAATGGEAEAALAADVVRGQPPSTSTAAGVFVFRERAELYERINRRVEKMFADGVVDEVRALPDLGSTAEKALGLREIRALLAGETSEEDCIARIQQATRHYAKRQLTWFQRQNNFEPLNLSFHGFAEAIELIAQNARLAFSQRDD